jgi:hypothetical protein
MEWILLAQDREKWWTLVENIAMNLMKQSYFFGICPSSVLLMEYNILEAGSL